MQKIKLPVEQSSSLAQAVQRFLDSMNNWIDRTIALFPVGFKSNSHDGGTFMTPWEIYGKTTGDQKVVKFMRDYRDQAKKHFETMNQWLDGYWRKQEVHHGTEHFSLFIRTLWRLQPDDSETVRQLEDAAEHIGNWKTGFPEWFNWQTGMFRSFHLGTEFVGEPACNVPEVKVPSVTGPIGMRHDKPDWLDQDGEPAPSPLLWILFAQIANDHNLLTRAVDLARTHFQLAELAFGEFTHHGCGSASLAAVCRGHGRLNNAGVVTEVLVPAIGDNQKIVD